MAENTNSNNGALYLIVGGLVVAVGVGFFAYSGGHMGGYFGGHMGRTTTEQTTTSGPASGGTTTTTTTTEKSKP